MPDDAHIAPVSRKSLTLAGLVGLVIVAVVVIVGLVTRVHADQSLKAWTSAQQIPTVTLAAMGGSGDQGLTLPANIEAFNTAPIHARVSGYLKRWYVDIGAHVKAGPVAGRDRRPGAGSAGDPGPRRPRHRRRG